MTITHYPNRLLSVKLIVSRRKIYMQSLNGVIIYHSNSVAVKIGNCKLYRSKLVHYMSHSVKRKIHIIIYRYAGKPRNSLAGCRRSAYHSILHICVSRIYLLISVSHINFCISWNRKHFYYFCLRIKACKHNGVCTKSIHIRTHQENIDFSSLSRNR